MRALAVVVALVAGIAWIMAAMIFPEFSEAVLASAGPDRQLGMGLRARLLQNDILNYALVGLVATIGAALLWRAGRPSAPALPPSSDWRASPPAAPLPSRACPNCSAAIVPGQRFCGQCGAQLAAQPLAATDYVNPRFASERLPGVNPARACESCGRTGTVAEGKCTACGFDHLTRKGPHSGRG